MAVTAGLLASLLLPFSASAQTSTADLLQQIQNLMAQVKSLQTQLVSIQQQQVQLTQQTQATVAELVTTLQQGSQGDEVTQLQTLLALDPSIYPEGLITGYYGGFTRLAVQRFQRKWGIEDVGFVGPRTRLQLNSLWRSHLASSTEVDEDVAEAIQNQISSVTLPPLPSDPCAIPTNPLSSSSPVILKDGKQKIVSVGNVFFYQDGKHRVLITPNTYHEKDGKKQLIITPGIRIEKDGKFRSVTPCHGTTTPPTGGNNDTTPPVISSLGATANVTTATVSWITNEAATGKVYYGTTSPVDIVTASSLSNNVLQTGHSFSLSGLTATTTYYYLVVSKDTKGNTATSSQQSFITANTPDTTAPVITAISTSNVSTSSVEVHWTTNEAASSKVYYSTTTPVNTGSAPVVNNATLVTSHQLQLTGLVPNTTYYFVIQSTDTSSNTATASETSFTTSALPPADTTPPAISAVNVGSIASTTASVSWTTNEAATSKVYYGTATPLNLGSAMTVASGTLVTNHAQGLSGLMASTTYYYVVESADAASNTATSTESSFTTTN